MNPAKWPRSAKSAGENKRRSCGSGPKIDRPHRPPTKKTRKGRHSAAPALNKFDNVDFECTTPAPYAKVLKRASYLPKCNACSSTFKKVEEIVPHLNSGDCSGGKGPAAAVWTFTKETELFSCGCPFNENAKFKSLKGFAKHCSHFHPRFKELFRVLSDRKSQDGYKMWSMWCRRCHSTFPTTEEFCGHLKNGKHCDIDPPSDEFVLCDNQSFEGTELPEFDFNEELESEDTEPSMPELEMQLA